MSGVQIRCQGPGCDVTFEAKRAAAKYHSERCKKRAQRSPAGAAVPRRGSPAKPPAPVAVPGSLPVHPGLIAATEAQLDAAGQLDSPAGQAALVLAARIENGEAETGNAVAAMVRQLHATLAEALKDAPAAADPVDELRARREQKLRGTAAR